MMIGDQIDQTLTDQMVERAIVACAEAHFAGDTRRARHALLQGQCEHCKCVSDCLVSQICAYLGQMDKTLKAIYQYEPDTTHPNELKEHMGINLVAWVERKSAAFSALVNTLETFLAASQRQMGCVKADTSCFVLDIQMVDDRDVQECRGHAMFVEHPRLQSKLVWSHPTQTEPASPKRLPEPSRVAFALPDSFDPELIPESRLIEHALSIERVPLESRMDLEHHLTELKVTLIRRMISDQLAYINIAKHWFDIGDLANIYNHRLGFGKIGGKAAGMLLAARILNEVADEEIRSCVSIPETYFLGADTIYIFMAMNGLMYWNDQKYKPEEQIREEYPQIQTEFQAGSFPPEILAELKELLINVGRQPLIVRSSSQLEDNFGTAFAGKYDSFFCPNQGTPEENLKALTCAISRTYASTLNPGALLYRRSKGLQDYDERMAVIIQVVQGSTFGRYYLPLVAGVAFSHNLYRWSPQIRSEDGFARLVWGFGTRAVQRVGNDFPHLVALSHPTLQPDSSVEAICRYSQQYVDLIDLEENDFKTLPIHAVLEPHYPGLRLLGQLAKNGYLSMPRTRMLKAEIPYFIITFDELLRNTAFPRLLTRILRLLEAHYHKAVDVEFTVRASDLQSSEPDVQIVLLQCRPQSQLQSKISEQLPDKIASEDIVFSTKFMVPQGSLAGIRHVVFVEPEGYFSLATPAERQEVGRVVGRLNNRLGNKQFICVGPGRWGTNNLDLGVPVTYADICNAGALVEMAGGDVSPAPEASLGTHFFQDLMEAEIYPLVICLDDERGLLNRDFFYNTPSCLEKYLPEGNPAPSCVRLIEIQTYRPEYHLQIVMDSERSLAVAYLVPDS